MVLFLSLFFFFFLQRYSAQIITYEKKTVNAYSYDFTFKTWMYNKKDAPALTSPGDGDSYVHFNLKVKREKNEREGNAELIIIPKAEMKNIGVMYKDNKLHICCSWDLMTEKLCNRKDLGRLIINNSTPGVIRYDIPFNKDQTDVDVVMTQEIQITGVQAVAIGNCQYYVGKITFEGQSEWMNPYGYLPGNIYKHLPFYRWMIVVYLALTIIWFLYIFIFWKDLLRIQNFFTGLVILCLIEMIIHYRDYLHWNNVGIRSNTYYTLGIMVTITREVVARVLTVVIAEGYGVIKSTLGPMKHKLIVYACVHWMIALSRDLSDYKFVNLILICLSDVLIIFWTLIAISQTLHILKTRKQSTTSLFYQLSVYIYYTYGIFIAIFTIYRVYYMRQEKYLTDWDSSWLMSDGYLIIFTVLLIPILILWRPSTQNKAYVYELQVDQYEGEDDNDYNNTNNNNTTTTNNDNDNNNNEPNKQSRRLDAVNENEKKKLNL